MVLYIEKFAVVEDSLMRRYVLGPNRVVWEERERERENGIKKWYQSCVPSAHVKYVKCILWLYNKFYYKNEKIIDLGCVWMVL